MSRWALIFVLAVGCSSGGAKPAGRGGADGGSDARDLASAVEDLAGDDLAGVDLAGVDLAGRDLASVPDLSVPRDLSIPPDLSVPRDLSVPPDLTVPRDLSIPPDLASPISQNVDIYVDNFCRMDVIPKKFDVPAGTSLKLTYVNHSRDYPVDVWLSYGGGFLDLKTGTSWTDRIEHCRGLRPSTVWADISTACSRYRLMINCL